MNVGEIVRVTKGRLVAGYPRLAVDLARISSDTRSFRRGDVFLALCGDRFDGNDFVAEAFAKGAAGAIVSRWAGVPAPGRMPRVPSQGFVIRVADTTRALQAIAAYHRSQFRIPVIAVTGSNGKTTVKEMCAAVLGKRYRVLKNEGTKNNHLGVPQTLLKLDRRHGVCILEFGTNHPGEIRALAKLARPTASVITNIGPSHLEFFGDLNGVFREKRQIVSAFRPGARPAVFLNADDPYLARFSPKGCAVTTFGFAAGAAVRGEITGRTATGTGILVNGAIDIFLPVPGVHNASNALAAAAVALRYGVGARMIRNALASFKPASMRLNIRRLGGYTVINDAYNANPSSMERALDVVRDFPAAKRWVVSADMLELGKEAAAFHRAVGAIAARSRLAGLLAFGAYARDTLEGARTGGMRRDRLWCCATRGEIAARLAKVVKRGDVVLLKGSRSMKLEEVLRDLERRKG